MIKKLLYKIVIKTGKFKNFYVRFYHLNGVEYGKLLKDSNYFYSMGEGSRVTLGAIFTDPKYVKIGSNTLLSACTLIGHDGSIAVFSKVTDKVLDKVGKIIIGDNCFIGHGAIIMPDTIIGDNCIVAAGSVVTKDVDSGSIVGGVPARVIGNTADYIDKIARKTMEYPWYDILKDRKESYDPLLEPKLREMRLDYFFNNKLR